MADKFLTIPAAKLARHDHQGWTAFLEGLRDYTETRVLVLLKSPSDSLHNAQGQAAALHQLLLVLETCIADADKMEKK